MGLEISAKKLISLPPPGPTPGALAALPKIRTKIQRRLYRISAHGPLCWPPKQRNWLFWQGLLGIELLKAWVY
jgi:hypothetical protein